MSGSSSEASSSSRRFARSGGASRVGAAAEPLSSASSFLLPRFRPFAQLLRAELDALYHVQRARRALPLALRWLCDRLLSAHPFYDLSIAFWMAAPFALASYGWVLWWLLVLNMFTAFIVHWTLDAPSPADLDARLRPRGRLSPSGFPCMELQIATSLLAYVAWWHGSVQVWIGCLVAGGALFALRVYALTHFFHQLVLSVLLGGLSVPAGRAVARYFFKARLDPQLHGLGVVFVIFVVAGFIAYHAEMNAVPFMRIPRAECAFWCAEFGGYILNGLRPLLPPFKHAPLYIWLLDTDVLLTPVLRTRASVSASQRRCPRVGHHYRKP